MAPPHKHEEVCLDEEIRPLSSWQELVEWREPEGGGEDQLRKLLPRTPSMHPSTLLCHDMKGGYLDDRFVGGCSNKDAYRFYHWSGVDTFVYFSHHLVTIPPPGWINAAHLHGVTVLGTFITEWEAGSAVCKELLASEATVATAVTQLTHIAKHHVFEGWLINIENEVPPEKIPLLLHFLRELTAAMKTNTCKRTVEEEKEVMKADEGESDNRHCVIWYDSVTKDGKLNWQNELNSLNQAFFDACDAIFLNYTWTEAHLERTKEVAKGTVGDSGGGRVRDVFVGLDVFGRNFYAGGKYNTWKALQVVRKYGLSAAVFAPGWTYQTQDDFVGAERQVWKSLAPYLTHRGPQDLPLITSFCQGFGEHFFCRGKVEREGPWHNLSLQQLQPLWSQEEEGTCISLFTQEAFSGGGCLQVTTRSPSTVRLLVCGLGWQGVLRLSVAYKWCSSPTTLALVCRLTECGRASSSQHSILEFRCEERKEGHTKKEEEEGEWEDNQITECPLVDSRVENGWSVRVFRAQEVPGYKVSQVAIRIGGPAELRLGHLDITSNR